MVRALHRIFARRDSWVALAALLLVVDYFSSAVIQFPITFIFPVMLAAWHRRLVWSLAFAVLLPLGRLGFHLFVWEQVPWSLEVGLVNFAIRTAVLTILALLTNGLSVQYHELTTKVVRLQGLLPICMMCKKIRDENDDWQPLESYFGKRTSVVFNHRCCPECTRRTLDRAHPEVDPQLLSFCE
jgi:hypothetical protein